MSWIVRFCSCSKWKASAPRPCVRPPARHPGGGLPFAVLRAAFVIAPATTPVSPTFCPLPGTLPTFCHFHQSAATAVDSSATVAAFASHRSGCACALAAPFGVRHRFAACPTSITHARRTRQLKVFCHSRRRHPALVSVLHFVRTWICYVRCLRFRLPPAKHSPSPRRITPLLFLNPTKFKKKQPPPDLRPSLSSDVDLLWPLSALKLATGQAFTIAQRSLPKITAPPTVVPNSPPSHQR